MMGLNPWQNINAELALYRYQGQGKRLVKSEAPILMLHGPMTSHRTWDQMGDFLWNQGFDHLYGVDIPDVQMGGSLRNAVHHLRRLVFWLLETYDMTDEIVIIGHSTGGVLGRRLLFKVPELAPHIAYLFSLGSPHPHTHFSYQVYVPPEENPNQDKLSSSYVKTPYIPTDTFMINMFGNSVGPRFDGTVHGVYLPEAVNIMLRLGHTELKQHPSVLEEIGACLRGERYRMQIYLQSMYMRTPDQDEMVGPFYFEVNGMRSPFDGIFQAIAEHQYTFSAGSTPLATLAYPMGQTLASTVFRLKDLSRTRSVRRRLFAKLLDSLNDNETVEHEMQDNEGSKITVRIHTQKMPTLLPTTL